MPSRTSNTHSQNLPTYITNTSETGEIGSLTNLKLCLLFTSTTFILSTSCSNLRILQMKYNPLSSFFFLNKRILDMRNIQSTILTPGTGKVVNPSLFTKESVNRESQREGNNALLKGKRESPCRYCFITSKTVTPPWLAFDRLTRL